MAWLQRLVISGSAAIGAGSVADINGFLDIGRRRARDIATFRTLGFKRAEVGDCIRDAGRRSGAKRE